MTDMKRVTISIPEDMYVTIFELRKTDAYVKCSYSEIVRKLMESGLQAEKAKVQKGRKEKGL